MELDWEKPELCAFCGGIKPDKNGKPDASCPCTCSECSDEKEIE